VVRSGDGSIAFSAALVEVADQEIRAAGIAQLPDVSEKVGDGNGRFLVAAPMQVLPLGPPIRPGGS
jgi:hypothetical protein